MSETRIDELLQAVTAFLQNEVSGKVDSYTRYHLKVAANCLAIAQRELSLNDELREIDRRAAEQYGIDRSDGDIADQISQMIKHKTLNVDQVLLDYLHERTLKKLEIDNPRYSGYLRARELWLNNEDSEQ